MFERLDQIEIRYEELTQALLSPEITNDSAKYQKTARAHSEVAGIVEKYREYKDLKRGIAESRTVLVDEKDPEMRAYAEEELAKLDARIVTVEEDLKFDFQTPNVFLEPRQLVIDRGFNLTDEPGLRS